MNRHSQKEMLTVKESGKYVLMPESFSVFKRYPYIRPKEVGTHILCEIETPITRIAIDVLPFD